MNAWYLRVRERRRRSRGLLRLALQLAPGSQQAGAQAPDQADIGQHPQYTKPQLMATGPNQLWSWDITKLLGPKKWTYYYLYVVLDIFSPPRDEYRRAGSGFR